MSVYKVIEDEITPFPSYLKVVLHACALDSFICMSCIEDEDFEDIRNCVSQNV
jgi:hypothetical protein